MNAHDAYELYALQRDVLRNALDLEAEGLPMGEEELETDFAALVMLSEAVNRKAEREDALTELRANGVPVELP